MFILVGYGTKAGLAPMHTWLPDAHSEAPAPLSAMMSGVLLAVALYADHPLEGGGERGRRPGLHRPPAHRCSGCCRSPSRHSASWSQRNYKRMLAYSSIEHIGLMCVGLGARAASGSFAAMLHLAEPRAGEGRDEQYVT